MAVAAIKKYLEDVNTDLNSIEGNLDKAHEGLVEIHKEYNKSSKISDYDAAKESFALDISWKKDQEKYKTAKEHIEKCRETINKINSDLASSEKVNDPSDFYSNINNNIQLLEKYLIIVKDNISYVYTRSKHDSYTLGTQEDLVKAGYSFTPEIKVLSGQIKDKIHGYSKIVDSTKVKLIKKLKERAGNLPQFGSPKPLQTKSSEIQKNRDKLKSDIETSLQGGPRSFESMNEAEKHNILKYVGGRKKSDTETDLEKSIYSNLGLNKQQLLELGSNKKSESSPMTKALVPYTPPANKPSPVSVSSALPSMSEVLRQQQGLPSSSSIYPDVSKLSTSTMSTAMVPYSGPSSRRIAASKKLKAAMENNVIPQTSIPGLRGDKNFEDKRAFYQSANFGQPSGAGGTGLSGSSAKKTYSDILNVRIVEIIPEPLDSLKTIFHSAMAEALDYYSASPKLKVHLESIGNSISQLFSSLFNQGTSTTPGQTNPGTTNPNQTNPGTTNPGSTGSGGGGTTNNPTSPAALDPFQKRLKKIFKEGEEELTLLYAKTDSFVGWIPGFNKAILSARKKGLETLEKGYKAFDAEYVASGGSAIKGMWASVKAMFKVSPFTLIMAGLTTAFIGILDAATRLNSKIKEISAELGTSNMQSYEFFKNAMNAQTQYDNMYASLRDVRDVQKGILGDSGILLQVNDKALSSIADNAKNIGVSTEAAGAFTDSLRMKGATDIEAANLMAASLELADKSKFIMPQSVMDDIAQNVEFSSKYFSGINKDSKSAQKHLVDTNLQVKALGLNFQKAAKMTQHLLSFEQSITSEVEASVALGRHVNIGKARELLLQDDIGGAMEQMMNEMGGYDAFQNDMDFAQRQLLANAIGMEVSELEKSLYLREKIGITNEEALNAAMKNSDYLDKVAGKDVELYKIEAKKVLAAEQFNTAVEKVSVAFKSSLLPILEAIVPIVEMMASAINFVAAGVKYTVGGLASVVDFISGGKISSKRKDEKTASPAEMASGGALMASAILGTLMLGKSKAGGKLGEVVGKARGGLDAVTGTLGSKSNPMYVQVVGGIGGAGGIGEILDSTSRGGRKGGRAGFLKRLSTSKEVLDRAKSIQKIRDARLSTPKTGAFAKIGQYMSKVKPASMVKLGGALAVVSAGYDIYNRKQQGQSTTQAITGTAGGVAGGLLGAKGGAVLGATLGTAIAGPVGTAVGAALGGIVGGVAGYYAGGAIVDSQFKPNEFKGGFGMYAGMNGMSGGGGISTSLNKPKATGTPVETSMVDMTPTTFKSTSTGLSGITPNYGTTSMARESVMVNTVSKSLEATALMNSIKEKNIEKEKANKELMQQQLKILESIREKINQPAVAYFNEEGRRQAKNYIRKESSP